MNRRVSTWAALVAAAFLTWPAATNAQLDNSSWPVAGAGRATQESVLGTTSNGTAIRAVWNLTGLGAEPTGTGGGVLSSDGYIYFRNNGAGNLYKVNTATGAIDAQVAVGSVFRSAPVVGAGNKLYVSTGDDTAPAITCFDRTVAGSLPVIWTTPAATATDKSAYRSIQMGSVAYDVPAHLRIYVTRRVGDGAYVTAYDAETGAYIWESAKVQSGSGGNSGLCQLGPMWEDGDTGDQMMAFCVGNGSPGIVYLIRDDGAAGTVVASQSIDATYVNGQGALSDDGTRIYYNSAWDGGKPALRAVSTTDASIIWELPNATGVSSYVGNPAVVGTRVYMACASGNVVCVEDQGATYSLKWVYNVGESGEFTSISATRDTNNRTYLYCSNGSSHKLYRIEDLGNSATTLAVMDFLDAPAWGGCSTTIDADGSVYQFGGTNGGLSKYVTGTPPVADAGPDTNATCYAPFNVDASGSHGVGGPTIVNYKWTYDTDTLYDGPNAMTSLTLPVCNGVYQITLTVTDSAGFEGSDTMDVTVGTYPDPNLDFSSVDVMDAGTPVVGDSYKNGLASDGTYLYYLNENTGAFYRGDVNGGCTTWTTLATAPGVGANNSSIPPEDGAVAYIPPPLGGTMGSLVTFRAAFGVDNCGHDQYLATYDIASGIWSWRGNRGYGFTGFTVAGNYLFANRHAVDTNQGGPITRADLANLDNYACERTGIKASLLGDQPNWMSRVVQLAYNPIDGMVYGFKNDQAAGGAASSGNRLFKFDPTAFVANTWTGTPPADCFHQTWTNNPQTPATDMGNMPFDPGYGSALTVVPANWKGLVGAQGGLFVVFGAVDSNLEGWGNPNNRYGVYDLATDQWAVGTLPGYSTYGTAVAFHDGNVWIKQGSSSSSDPQTSPTSVIWYTAAPLAPPTADAGMDQTVAGTCGEYTTVSLSGTSPNTITAWDWYDGATLLAQGQNVNVDLKPGTHEITLVVTDDNCTTGSDTVSVTVNAAFTPPPISITMNQQINDSPFGDPAFDVITIDDVVSGFEYLPLGSEEYCRTTLAGGGFHYAPTVHLDNACYDTPIDLTVPGMHIQFEARYFQAASNTNRYGDAPIGVLFVDTQGRRGGLGLSNGQINWLYGPTVSLADLYPAWKTCEAFIDIADPDPSWTDDGFDPTKVVALQFFHTDWAGAFEDYIDLKNLTIDQRGACCTGSTCAVMTQDDCTTAGGDWQGYGVDCGQKTYTYGASSISAALEDISGTGTALTACDDCGYLVPLGFTFNFNGVAQTQVGVASNGYLAFNYGIGSSGNDAIPSINAPNDMIAPAWFDWNPTAQGTVYYETLGTAPNRRFIAMWDNVAFYGEEGNESNTFEAILYESSDTIEFRYGAVLPRSGTPSGYGVVPTVGVESVDGSSGLALDFANVGSGGPDATWEISLDSVTDTNPCAAVLLGDMNCDGVVNGLDIDGMVRAVLNPADYASQYPSCNILSGDFTSNGMVELNDVGDFVTLLLQ